MRQMMMTPTEHERRLLETVGLQTRQTKFYGGYFVGDKRGSVKRKLELHVEQQQTSRVLEGPIIAPRTPYTCNEGFKIQENRQCDKLWEMSSLTTTIQKNLRSLTFGVSFNLQCYIKIW